MVMSMRRVLVVSVALVGGCFSELPAMPGTGSGASSTTSETGSTTLDPHGTSQPGVPTGSSGGPSAGTTDADAITTGTTTGEPPGPPGLFACIEAPMCALWDCTGACTPDDPGGACVLAALRDRMDGALQVSHCDKECAVHLLLPRGSGTDTVLWQWQRQGEPVVVSEARQCTLLPEKFFADCLESFAPDCADPAAWLVDCGTIDSTCP